MLKTKIDNQSKEFALLEPKLNACEKKHEKNNKQSTISIRELYAKAVAPLLKVME